MGGIVNAVADVVGLGPASKQSKATTQAADTSAAAARYAADLQRQMFDKQIELQDPFRQAGLAGQNRLMQLLGLTPTATPQANFTPAFDEAAYLRKYPDVARAVAQGKFESGLQHYNLYGEREKRLMPMTQPPAAVVVPKSADFGKYARDFSMKDFTTDPGYAFRMKEGLTALDRQAAARGGLISGGALKAAQRYGQDLGSQEYTNAFNRYQTNRANQLAPLQSLAGLAQTSANTLGNAAANYGTNAGNIAMTGGANQANAYLTKGNIAASQYGTYGKALDEALNTDWSSVGNKIKGFFQ